jgi:hypothetical protein
MMRYYLDTEFREGPVQRRFLGISIGKPIDTIDLISIGITTDEEGYNYSAINGDCDLNRVWKNEWLRMNVLQPIFMQYAHDDEYFFLSAMKRIFKEHGKPRKMIASDIAAFMGFYWHQFTDVRGEWRYLEREGRPEIYGYFADYDWVNFCWLFGRMIDLPKGMPRCCIDLKQMLDTALSDSYIIFSVRERYGINDHKMTLQEKLDKIKAHQDYPKAPKAEHDALEDAKWNRSLYYFITQKLVRGADYQVQ